MAEYSTKFAKNLINVAKHLTEENQDSIDSERAILYLCLLASEVLLKSILERAGVSIQELKSFSHDIPKLFNKVCEYQYYEPKLGFVSAVRIRAITLKTNDLEYTIGQVLSLSDDQISKYPNQLRYGDELCHYPAFAVMNVSEELYKFTVRNKDTFMSPISKNNNSNHDVNYKNISSHTKLIVENFLKKIGGGIKIGEEIDFHQDGIIRDLDFWIGYTFLNFRNEIVGEIISGYVLLDDFRVFTEITIESETIESSSIQLINPEKSTINKEAGIYKFIELEAQMIKTIERAMKRNG